MYVRFITENHELLPIAKSLPIILILLLFSQTTKFHRNQMINNMVYYVLLF